MAGLLQRPGAGGEHHGVGVERQAQAAAGLHREAQGPHRAPPDQPLVDLLGT